MAASISTSSFNNPYSDFLSIRRSENPQELMKRFRKDVRLPHPHELITSDPLEPMRRFSRDVQPPRYVPIHPATGGSLSSLSADWNVRPYTGEWQAAVSAYKSSSSFNATGTTINSFG